jgi:uncharacterized protein with ParB-like and HNH nuclease domain
MDIQVRTPQQIFMQTQRLSVPFFQRPYVWNQKNKWMPLWQDLERVANRVLASPDQQQPYFLGMWFSNKFKIQPAIFSNERLSMVIYDWQHFFGLIDAKS